MHLRDIARPLRLDADVPTEHWAVLLDYLASPGAAAALVPPGRIDRLRLVADETGQSWGAGHTVVQGPIEAIGMAVTGRPAALEDLRGDGVAHLAGRLGNRPGPAM